MRIFFFLSFLVLASGILNGETGLEGSASDTLTARSLDEVVITANRFNSLGVNTPEAVRVLNGTPVHENQLRTAPEALSLTPGVFVQKTNHGGGSPIIRGLTGNQTLLLMDGIRISNSTMRYGPNQYFNTIDVFSIDRMEVLRGSGSVQYGSDALGGTIQAFSHELNLSEKPLWGGRLLSRFGTSGMEQTLHSAVKYSGRNAAFRAGAAWRNFGDVMGGDTTGRQDPSGYKEFDYDIKGKLQLSPRTSVTVLFQSVHQTDVPVYHKIALENYAVNKTDPQLRKLAYLRLNQQIDEGIIKSAVFTASFQKTEEGRVSWKNGADIVRFENDKVKTFGFSAEALLSEGDRWSASAGFDLYNDYVSSNRIDRVFTTGFDTPKRGLYPDGSSMTSLALFTVHSYDLDKWNFTAGVRFNSFIINVPDEELGDVKLTPSALVGNIAAMRKLDSKSNLFVSLNTGFRAPNIDDLGTLGIVDFRYETPDYDLKPESSLQYQIGYKFLGKNIKGDLFLYQNELYNLITRKRVGDQMIEGYPLYRKENSERAFVRGVETAWDFVLNRSITLYSSLTCTYGQNKTKDEPMRRIPPLFGRLALDYRNSGWLLNAEILSASGQERLAQGDIDDNRIPEGGTPGWTVVNINAGYTWRFLSVDLSLKNLFNVDYRYHGSGINGYGRSLFLTAGLNF